MKTADARGASAPATRSESLLDGAVEMTFPASDPISVDHAFGEAARLERPVSPDSPAQPDVDP